LALDDEEEGVEVAVELFLFAEIPFNLLLKELFIK
jgi:hypothetical protein